MRDRILMVCCVLACAWSAGPTAAVEAPRPGDPAVNAVISARLRNADLVDAIAGILFYLDDSQVRDRSGRRSSFSDASEVGEGCKDRVDVNLPLFTKTFRVPALPQVDVRNVAGEWQSSVHFLPKKMGAHGLSFVAIPDSNLFVPAFVTYPLFLFRESGVARAGERPIARMLRESWHLDRHFKRGAAYNFWSVLPDHPNATGPLNIPIEKALVPLAKSYLNPKLAWFWRIFAKGLAVPPPDWIVRCLDTRENPSGPSALFNIPNDTDDTATTIALQRVRRQLQGVYRDDPFFSNPANFELDQPAMDLAVRFRDVGRDAAYEDGRDAWKGRDTGAYLTWMRDEKEPTFSEAERGIVPLGKNNVDVVVNANVTFALGVLGQRDAPGYASAITLLNRAIEKSVWPAAGLYYPQFMIFPYCVSRAYRDGGNEGLRPGMALLLRRLIALQRERAASEPAHAGSFPGGEDRYDFVSTALGVTALLNIGSDVAREAGLEAEHRTAIEAGIHYLLATRRESKLRNPETTAAVPGARRLHGYRWGSGLFFSASFWDLAQWRSEAFASAMILEAFAKYLLAYDQGGVDIVTGRRLHVEAYPRDMGRGRPGLALTVR